ncbi:MAG: radical SAM protein [Kiritimatiellae bacterium]|nr:radical SAM protein [Kiritimatiellia bacterium]
MNLSQCELCPRRCGRRPGFCGAEDKLRIFRWGPHFGEEPPISGERGSGCIFFSRCTMKCLYCQNSPWSWKGGGKDYSVEELAAIMRKLAVEDKVGNWNLVSPTPYLPFIRESAAILKAEGIQLPFVWNSSGYERVETLEEYSDLCDTALFDLRYSRDETSVLASAAPNYVSAAREAVKWASKNAKVIVRILVLPGHAHEAVENLNWLAKEVSNEIAVSIMSQYTPAYGAISLPPFNRRVTEEEYESVVDAADNLGFENGWIQGFESSDSEMQLFGENMNAGYGVTK